MESLLEHVFRNVLGVEEDRQSEPVKSVSGMSANFREDLPCLIADTMPLGQSSSERRDFRLCCELGENGLRSLPAN